MDNGEFFKKLSSDQKLDVLKTQLDLFLHSISERMRILPSISALAATLLVVATFNEKLIPINSVVKFLLSLLLILIPISLFFYNRDLKNAQQTSKKRIEEYLGEKDLDKELEISNFDKFIAIFPDIAIGIISFVITVLLVIIWNNH